MCGHSCQESRLTAPSAGHIKKAQSVKDCAFLVWRMMDRFMLIAHVMPSLFSAVIVMYKWHTVCILSRIDPMANLLYAKTFFTHSLQFANQDWKAKPRKGAVMLWIIADLVACLFILRAFQVLGR
jgi:hypothetical protein